MKLATRRLGQSDLEITRVGIGTAPMGSIPTWYIYWGQQNESTSMRAIAAAIDLGVNWIDTAAVYGLGHAEQLVGQLLRRVPASRRPLVFTKGSLVWDPVTKAMYATNDPRFINNCKQWNNDNLPH